ncbi:MAG: RNA-binding protein [Gammaproteobacteria bacterium]|nr:RNA-binding protein [Gammaproteobacteria bacterium]
MNLYIGNLPYSLTEQQLSDLFSAFGTVDKVNIIKDRETGNSKGFGFVEMADSDQATTAMSELNGNAVEGREIKISEARPRAY